MVQHSTEGFRPGFHVFRHRGDALMLDVGTHSIIQLKDAAFDYLSALERSQDHEVALAETVERHDVEDVANMLREIEMLEEMGFFQREVAAAGHEQRRVVDGLLAHRPRNIMLLVTEACNLKCTYCYEVANDFHSKARQLTENNARKIVDGYFERSGNRDGVTVTFFGGEPLVNFPLIKAIVAHALEKGRLENKEVGFSITTNATLLTEEIADFLIEHEFGVMVSIDGDEESHDRYRVDKAGNGTYQKVIRRARGLLEKQLRAGVRPLKVRATMTSHNLDRQALVDHFTEVLPGARLAIGSSSGTAFMKEERDIGEEHQPELRKVHDAYVDDVLAAVKEGRAPRAHSHVAEGLGELVSFMDRKRPGEVAHPKLCGVGRNMMAVTPTGDVYPCHRYVGSPAWLLGNVHRERVDGKAFRPYYEQLMEGFQNHCTRCWMRFRCGGQCPWYLSRPDGTIVPPDESSCDSLRYGEETLLWLYSKLVRDHPQWVEQHLRPNDPTPKPAISGSATERETEAGSAWAV